MKLGDIRVVDLGNSVVDANLSKPDKGEYVFLSKKYVGYREKGTRPDYAFKWCRYDPRNAYRELNEWRITMGYTPVSTSDPFWPEGVPPNAEGNYVYGDLILVKCPLINEIKRIMENRELSRAGATNKMKAFKSQMKREQADIPDDMIDEMIGV